jgi:phage/plasmid primase-like uncharacterized protein
MVMAAERDPITLSDAEAMLSHLSADCGHDERARLAGALYSEFGEAAQDAWMAWAGNRSKPDLAEDRSTWRSAKQFKRVKVGTLIKQALDAGYKFPERSGEARSAPDQAALARQREQAEQRRLAEEAQYRERADKAARAARDLWAEGALGKATPYTQRKGVDPIGTKALPDGTLLVPMRDGDDLLQNVQRIAPVKPAEGTDKRFMAGGRKSGLFTWVGRDVLDDAVEGPRVVLLAEGWATGASLHMATGLPVLVCFDAGNLAQVVEVAPWPAGARILICGDDDRATAERTGRNPGRDKAEAAMRKAQRAGVLAACVFPGGLAEGGTDFNDLHLSGGLAAVLDQLHGPVQVLRALDADAIATPADDSRDEPLQAQPLEGEEAPAAADDERPEPPAEGASTTSRGSAGGGKKRKGGGDGSSDEPWRNELLERKGELVDCRENVYRMVLHHPALAGRVRYDEFAARITKVDTMPWASPLGEWLPNDDYKLGDWLAQGEGLLVKSEATLAAGIAMAAHEATFHPVREYLDSLTWDGTPRLEHWLSDHLQTADDAYHRMVGKWFIMGMVARILTPGCQMDNMLILEGSQGRRKSTALRVLSRGWFADTPIRLGDKDALLNLAGVWLYEVAELDSFNKAEVTAVKQYVTSRVDRVREPYARRAIDRPRACVMAGTTNQDEYFRDPTGSRRFWPVRIDHDLDLEGLEGARDQLFAEALACLAAGERYYPTREESEDIIQPVQEQREIVDPWAERIARWVDDESERGGMKSDLGRIRWRYSTAELLTDCLGVTMDRIDGGRQMATRVGVAMHRLGWAKHRDSKGARGWYYLRPGYGTDGGDLSRFQPSNPQNVGREVGRL